MSSEAIEFIKTLPAIFCDENANYGQVSDSQIALLGVVTDVFVQDIGIKIYYKTQYQIPQNTLNKIIGDLSIIGNEKYNELNRTHWCIKRNNLLQSLDDTHLL